jgi:hypothetical protein
LLTSDIVTNPPDAPDEFVAQLDRTVIGILDQLAPVRYGNRPHGRKSARWLSEEAVNAKRRRRRRERRWKSTRAESDRIAYRTACREAIALINTSRNQHRYQRISEQQGDSRRVWAAVKDLLHGEITLGDGNPEKNAAFCNTLATFFIINKVRNIKVAITASLTGRISEPLSSDVPCSGQLSEFPPVTSSEVKQLLASVSSKSSPLDVIPVSLLKMCKETFTGIIADLANRTFQHGIFQPGSRGLKLLLDCLNTNDLMQPIRPATGQSRTSTQSARCSNDSS